MLDHIHRLAEAVGAEEDPGRRQQAKGEKALPQPQPAAVFIHAQPGTQPPAEGPGDRTCRLVQAVEQTPYNKGPVRAVPQAAHRKHGDHVELGTQKAAPAAAQGKIQVLPEPGGEGDVPFFPEILHRGGQVGGAEVFRDGKAQHFRSAHGHVGIS